MIDTSALSRLGLGITGPHAVLGGSSADVARLAREAMRLGVTCFDTGPAYGSGRAEKRLGQALRGVRRDRAFVSTKAGIHTDRRRDFSAGAVEMSLKGSLERLGLQHVDLLLLHGPSREEVSEKLMRRLRALKERGLVRHIGLCGRGEELEAALDVDGFDAIMAPINPQISDAAYQRLERAKSAGLGVIGIEIMAGVQRPFRLPLSLGELWYAARSAKRALTGASPDASAMTANEALQWALAQPVCDTALCLTTKPSHLAANAAVAGLEASGQIT